MLNNDEQRLKETALDWFDAHEGEYKRDLMRWVSIPSVSDDSAGLP